MIHTFPLKFQAILDETKEAGFTQLSEPLLGSLLPTLSATKSGGFFLEFGTGSGLSTAGILDGNGCKIVFDDY